jgi:hypothetical protein
MFQTDRHFFIDSTDSDATENSERLNLKLSAPINADNNFNKVYLALQSFSITNTLYNVSAQDKLTMVVVYNDSDYPTKLPFNDSFYVGLPSGYYSATNLVTAWNTAFSTTGSSINSAKINHKDYTVSNVTNSVIAPKLAYNSITGLMSFEWSENTQYTIPNSQLNDIVNYPDNPAPSGVFFPLTSVSYYLLTRLGMYTETDTLTSFDDYGLGIYIPLRFTKTAVSGPSTQFSLVSTSYKAPHIFVEEAVGYVDLSCEQVVPSNYRSQINLNSPAQVLMRIPIIANFQGVQSVYYDNLAWCEVAQSNINVLQFTLRNPFTSEKILKCPLLIHIVIHEEKADLKALGTPADEQRYVPAITFGGKRSIDQMGNPEDGMTDTQRVYNRMIYR